MTLAAAAARGAVTTLGAQWIRFAVQFAGIAILARLLDPGDFGLISMVTAIIGFAVVIGDFGLSMATIQAVEATHRQRSNLFWLNTILGLALAGVILLAAPLIAEFYRAPELTDVTRALAAVFVLNAVSAQFRAEASRHLRFRWLASADVVAPVLGLGAAVTVALLGGGYWALVSQQLVIAISTFLLLVISARWLPGLPSFDEPMRPLLAFGANTLGVQVLTYLSSNVDSVLIGRFWGASALGYYDRAFQLFRMPLVQLASPLTRVAFPVLSRLQDDPLRFDRYLSRAHALLMYVMGGGFLLAAVTADPLIELVLGPGWDESKPILAVLAIGGVFQTAGYVYFWAFLAKGRTGLQLRFSLIGRSLMVAAIVVGVFWGPLGVAFGSAAGLLLNWLVLTLFAMPRLDIDLRGLSAVTARAAGVLLAAGACGLPVAVLTAVLPAPVQLSATVGAALAGAGAVVALVRPVRRDVAAMFDTARRFRR